MKAPDRTDLVAIMPRKAWVCPSCAAQFEPGRLLTMDDAGPLCLACADLGHLEFLPSGDAALTRRARRGSRLSAVVVQWSRTRKRYERQGILAEPEAIADAERACLADHDARARQRERDAQRRAEQDDRFVAELAVVIRRQFPGCEPERARGIARHAGTRSSGRIGRTSAGRALDADAVRLAVVASVRHEDTGYEALLMRGVPRMEARRLVRDEVDRIIDDWTVGTRVSGGVPAFEVGADAPPVTSDDVARAADEN